MTLEQDSSFSDSTVIMEQDSLKELIKRRGVEKGKLTLYKKYLSNLDPMSISAEQCLDLELRTDKMSKNFMEYEKIQDKIETISSEIDKELAERECFENSYYESIAKAKNYLNQKNCASSNSIQVNNASQPFIPESDAIKYPDISLPSFSGNITQWIEFRDSFDALVNQTNLKAIQKFKYLRGCLKDSALEVVSSLEYSEESYAIAWQLLCEHYNNPKVLVYNHLRALININNVPTNANSLRNLADNISKHMRTLKSLNISTENWDVLIIFLLSSKLEAQMQRKWEEKCNSRELPILQEFKSFLRGQADLQETLGQAGSGPSEQLPGSSRKVMLATSSPGSQNKVPPGSNTRRNQCPNCKENHYINQCPRFLALKTQSRIQTIKKLGLCLNCLGSNHVLPNCKASHCRTCQRKHHTLLHIIQNDTSQPNTTPRLSTMHTPEPIHTNVESQSVNLLTNQQIVNTTLGTLDNNIPIQHKTVVLSTAQITVLDNNNQLHTMRALLDSGSQSNYITESAYRKLNLPTQKLNMEVIGFNEGITKINRLCNLTINSIDNTYSTNLSCFIVPNICSLQSCLPNAQSLNIPKRFNLADISFYKGGEVDIIIGAELFYNLLCIGQHRLGDGLPILQRTRLGWVVSGCVPVVNKEQRVRCNFIQNSTNLLSDWDQTESSHDDITECEKVFATHTRTSDGNFVVKIPLQEPVTNLGASRPIAYKRFQSLESKFVKNPVFKDKYVEFMNDFIDAGHMIEKTTTEPCNYLPHHAVLNPQKSTTPLRVVIDASCKTSTGMSLNDLQHKGTMNQDNLDDILIRFRKHKYVICADIKQMYRNIFIHPTQQHLQCVFWRDSPHKPLKTYQLTTLSFGLKCAPYLATRCLKQLADENRESFPVASSVITSDFYMDDLIHGSDSDLELAKTAVQIDNILRSANFILRKWKSNSQMVLNKVNNSTHTPTNNNELTSLGSGTHKVLGLAWSSDNDNIRYKLITEPVPTNLTKRKVLSTASAIFDPLGLLGPIIIIAKCFIQRLWKLKINWDETLPYEFCHEWQSFYNQLNSINLIAIPRNVLISNYIIAELHGFCDSSLTAYGAAIYVRSIDIDNNVVVRLLCAKSRVARNETIPKLELRACLLLATLYNKVNDALKQEIPKKYLWSDSRVALAWINSKSDKLTTFVKNRVTEINKITDKKDWYWVCSKDNPADLLSRGMEADKLPTCALWWQGPAWLSQPTIPNDILSQPYSHDETLNTTNCNISTNSTNSVNTSIVEKLFERSSKLKKLNRCFAYVLRYIHNCKNPKNKQVNSLTAQELNNSLMKLIEIAQIQSYPTDYKLLSNNKPLPRSSNLLSLNPFLTNGIMRVGGRLGQSNFSYVKKHPIILPRHHRLTELIVVDFHKRLLHAGPQLLLSSLREQYWPVHGKQLVNKVVHKCVTCFRAKPKITTPIMGNLPPSRVNPTLPFVSTSVDYAGPFNIRDRRGRGYKASKCYIAVFVCTTTKAVHLELVSSLETNNFLAAFKRFISRRGKPKEMLSDNGTTFHGADNELKNLYNFLSDNLDEFTTSCASEGITWKYLSVYTPHMGGLHEAAVKSCKYHLKRVLGNSLLTFEEFSTVLTQVESILNSRPLCPITNSANDEVFCLTPAHFLIGRTPISIPDYDYTDVQMDRLTHYQQLQQLYQSFWQRWSRDYIGLLQTRTKWRSSKGESLRDGTIVLVKEDRLPPNQWKLGRIIKCCKGKDGVTRVAEIHTSSGVIKRAFNNICPLPINGSE